MNNLEKEQLIDKVIVQIEIDLKFGDSTSLYEILEKVDIKYLEAYLPEESLNPTIPNG